MILIDDNNAVCETITSIALVAGREIMRIYEAGAKVEQKADCSPVTEADRRGEAIILDGLHRHFPDVPVVAEEECAAGLVPAHIGDRFFLVDPLDGTREFINRCGDFTVNIALVRGGMPEIGVVYAPAKGQLYCGCPGHAWRSEVDKQGAVTGTRPIVARPGATPPAIVASRSHRTPETDEFIARFPGASLVSVGSSLKFCMVASGEADIYPRFGRTMEWDTAAGDAVLRAAGGTTVRPDGIALAYGKRNQAGEADFANPHFIARGAA